MKYLLLLLVVGVGLFLLFGRKRGGSTRAQSDAQRPKSGPATMLSCAHCGVHLPREDAVVDAAGLGFCSDAHRIAGPR